MAHTSSITTWGTLFTERLFSVSKEWVRSWSHASLIIYYKTFAKKLKKVRPKSCREVEKDKKQVQSWSHVSWITIQLFLRKKTFANLSRKSDEKEKIIMKKKRKKNRMAIAKRFAFQANAITLNMNMKTNIGRCRPEIICKKGIFKSFSKFTGKHLCRGLFFNKFEEPRPVTLSKRRLRHRCFPVN